MFVEIARDEELPNKIIKLVRDAEQVTGLLPWKFRFHKEDQFYHLDEVNLNRVIPTTADQYKFLTDDKVSDDINQLFQESRATVKRTGKELTMKTLYNKHTFIIEAVNVPNKNFIDCLPNDIVVEVPGILNKNGVNGIKLENYPSTFGSLLNNQAGTIELTTDAVLNKSKQSAYQALLADPVVDDPASAEKLLDKMIVCQKEYLGYLK